MNAPDPLFQIVQVYAVQAPWLVALFVGLVYAISRRPYHRRPANLVIAGILVMGLTILVMTPVTMFLPEVLMNNLGWPAADLRFVLIGAGVVRSIASAVGIGLLLAAAFVDRDARRSGSGFIE